MKKGNKITILGAGNVGASIAFALTMNGTGSELVLIDINKDKSLGEAIDIYQGTPFTPAVDITSGDYPDAVDSDMVIITMGLARKPGQTRIDLAQANVNILKEVMGNIVKYAPDALYLFVSNPVDILTYTAIKSFGLSPEKVIGSGTLLDSSRLRSIIAEKININPENVHATVMGEHGETSFIPWSLATIAGMSIDEYAKADPKAACLADPQVRQSIEDDMRKSGAKVIGLKGATNYAIALSVAHLANAILRDTQSVMTVSNMMTGQYGVSDVCLSLPYVVGAQGIVRPITPAFTEQEAALFQHSANSLKEIIASLSI